MKNTVLDKSSSLFQNKVLNFQNKILIFIWSSFIIELVQTGYVCDWTNDITAFYLCCSAKTLVGAGVSLNSLPAVLQSKNQFAYGKTIVLNWTFGCCEQHQCSVLHLWGDAHQVAA